MTLGQFSIAFEGTDVDDHTMDTDDLGTALLAIGRLTQEVFSHAAPADTRTPSVRVNATKPGSFIVDLGIDLTMLEQLKGLFDHDKMPTLADWATVAGVSITGLIGWCIRIVRRRAQGDEPTVDELADKLGNRTAAEEMIGLSRKLHVVNAVKKIAGPLVRNEGIINFTYNDHSSASVSIDQRDAHAIQRLDTSVEPEVSIVDVVATVATPHFDAPMKRKWRLKCAEYGTFTARLLDADFAERVAAHEVRCDGVLFQVRLRVEQVGGRDPMFEIITMTPVDDDGEQLSL